MELYLELLKKTLTFSLWNKTFIATDYLDYRSKMKRYIVRTLSWILSTRGLTIVRIYDPKDFAAQAHTMLPLATLDNIQFCVEDVIKNNVQGDLIETGVWRGGACIFMRGLLKTHGITNRKIFVADSFKGLPKPEWKEDKGDIHHVYKYLQVPFEEVRENFKKYDLLDSQVIFLVGWFKDTLRTPEIKKLAILRLDGDMYGSTMESMQYLYPKLSKGGYCIIDDWNLPNAQRAVVDYRGKNNITDEIKFIRDDTSCQHGQSVYWKKS